MKTRSYHKDKVNIVTLGCAKNLVDSEVMLTQLKGNGINAVHESNGNASIVIINTCGFIDNAKQESIDTILDYAKAKDQRDIKKLFVTGCLSHRYKDELQREIPEVDAWFGTMELPQLLKKFNADYRHELLGERIITTSSHYAYLKISEGCDRPCSFCAIPLMRGKHRSKPKEEIIKEARSLVRNGVKEIILIAQDSTYYGLDIYGKRTLADLLKELSDIENLEWIRLHYAFPSGFPKDVLKVMASRKNICNYLDIPLQHGASRMLKLMRRGIDRPGTEALIDDIREQVPGVALRTTLIVGHPGETKQDFNELLDFVNKSKFERLGVFTYSHEENTHSYTMEDDVHEKVKHERAEAVMELQERISYDYNRKFIGSERKVLIDRFEGGNFIGRTEYDSPEVDNEVLIKDDNHLRIGEFVNVKIKEALAYDLIGTARC